MKTEGVKAYKLDYIDPNTLRTETKFEPLQQDYVYTVAISNYLKNPMADVIVNVTSHPKDNIELKSPSSQYLSKIEASQVGEAQFTFSALKPPEGIIKTTVRISTRKKLDIHCIFDHTRLS